MTKALLDREDWKWLESQGISSEEAERQLAILFGGFRPHRLLRPATVGDGVERLDPKRLESLAKRALELKAEGAFLKFIPASGAASRMFAPLRAWLAGPGPRTPEALEAEREAGRAEAAFVYQWLVELPKTAFGEVVGAQLGLDLRSLKKMASLPVATFQRLLEALESWAQEPKALLPFHRSGRGIRTALEEQVWEGMGYLEDQHGCSRFHFTIPDGCESRFREAAAKIARELPPGKLVEIGFSVQERSTCTLAVDLETGGIARDHQGRPLLRPGGHGALLGNLARVGSPFVFIKNIDNVLPEAWHPEVAFWQLVLAGRLLERLEELGPRRLAPVRVVGVVPNRGEPGGGPFWVAGSQGQTLQIVERVEVDPADRKQLSLFEAATHFNPVQLVAALQDGQGRKIALEEWADSERMMLSEKREQGRRLRVLERPGLWNGGMARWETLCVEVPGHLFAPVKTALDFARPEHCL
jgi:hypothetical protein